MKVSVETTLFGGRMSVPTIFLKEKKWSYWHYLCAFTPTCSSTHLPGFEKKYQEIIDQGIDKIYCLSVNDAFTMFQWSKHLGISQVKMLPDGNADFTRAMGMLVKKENLGFGYRSWRYAMVVDDKNIVKMFSEPGQSDNSPDDPLTVSDVDTLLDYLKQQ